MSQQRYRQAKELLWDLVDACSERMPRIPHAAAALSNERDRYAIKAVSLDPSDEQAINAILRELPTRLRVLRGTVTW